jgi:DNA-binding transcriptional LysR family regulator
LSRQGASWTRGRRQIIKSLDGRSRACGRDSVAGSATLPRTATRRQNPAGRRLKRRLIRLFPGFDFPRAPLQLVYPLDRDMTPRMKSFVDFVPRRFG